MIKYPNPIKPEKLDLVMRDHDHVIYYAEKPLLSPGGNEIADPDIRLLKHILVKLTIYGKIDPYSVNSFAIFCFQKDHIAQDDDPLDRIFDKIFMNDPLVMLKTKSGAKQSLLDTDKALTYLEDHPAVLNLLFWGMPELGRRLTAFLDEISEGSFGDTPAVDEMLSLIKEAYEGLMASQKAAVNMLSCVHRSGIMLPLMLVLRKITPSEYANAILTINLNYELGNRPYPPCEVFEEKAAFTKIDRDRICDAYQLFHEQAIKAMEHLSFFTGDAPEQEQGIRDLIRAGESYNLEFKTSFRWDICQEKKNPAIEHASLKTISAFLNSSGGQLLIGVEDDGRVEGIEIDKFENEDKFLLHFWNMIKSSMGQELTPYIRTEFEKIDGGTVCHVKCLRSPMPVFLKQKGFDEEFYIRVGPSSASLEIREALKYIAERFA
ncbi:MAG: ATP-binding protein [Bacteroidales bacterium]|nr:ATP-binding protein [Bacteroidales bacterium]